MQWEDQEINYATPENKFPEVFFSSLELRTHAGKRPGEYIRIDQEALEEMIGAGVLSQRTKGVRIDRLCLFFRLFCRLGPGGGHQPSLGITHYWVNSNSRYAIFYFSPLNDWFDIMDIEASAPRT